MYIYIYICKYIYIYISIIYIYIYIYIYAPQCKGRRPHEASGSERNPRGRLTYYDIIHEYTITYYNKT